MFGNAWSELIWFYCSQAWKIERMCVCLSAYICTCACVHAWVCVTGRPAEACVLRVAPGNAGESNLGPWKPTRCAFLHPESWRADFFLIGSSPDTTTPPPPPHPIPTSPSSKATPLVVHISAIYSLASCNVFYSACETLFTPINWTYDILSISVFPIDHTSLFGHFSAHMHTHKIISFTPPVSLHSCPEQPNHLVHGWNDVTQPKYTSFVYYSVTFPACRMIRNKSCWVLIERYLWLDVCAGMERALGLIS